MTKCRHSAAAPAESPQERCIPSSISGLVPKSLLTVATEFEFGMRAAKGPSSILIGRRTQGCSIQIEGQCDRENSSGTAAQGLSPKTLTQDSRRQEENSVLIQLDAARGRGGVEPALSGRNFRKRYDATGVRPSSPIQIPPDSARLEGLAGLAPKEKRAQAFCASVDPLYLFSCGVSWHRERDASAGWELIQFLRSQDKGSRAIAASLLARTEHARLLIRDLRRARVRSH